MLMPSALSCDSSHPPVTRLQSALFASPPASPPSSAHSSTFGNIFSSCRTLQSMLTSSPATPEPQYADAQRDSLPTPPMTHTSLPPLKLRLRSRKSEANGDVLPRKKVVKRSAAPPRGVNKRRRAVEDDMGRDDDIDSDLEIGSSENSQETEESPFRPSTPKRARIAPEVIPLGLERTDYHNLQNTNGEESTAEGTEVEIEADGERWSKEDDRILVELVLEKLKLSKTDWQDCARSLGKDRSSIGRRWRSLMVNGDVGLKSSRTRRSKIHSTWR
ncbi:uncharacterized protein F4822DRAFT_409327 [Hypoxylon trugodes]|uniref:uncharacterized protein n=1 Tax=Hypoxylon trugodes TaxID=326681 RepID=UPI00219117C2|nr:uncharacterized protein F4822DRAFT_409327 [Hypoxylon trugodes]KAI1386220.1 hypothetical protein F4822DRAFT_409327 [Hypoxylon trugodes]